jgi:hypothetical protein
MSMDLYLPDEFYALSEAPNVRARAANSASDGEWLGGEAFVAPGVTAGLRGTMPSSEPDPIWRVV